ncbi:MAG: GNAT family N-acetyltransferase [Micavibrio sp.]
MISIRRAGTGDIPALEKLYALAGKKDDGYFRKALESADIYMAFGENTDEPCGFCLLNWRPRYGFYKKLGIPEIQDLNVAPAHRRKGIAGALIDYCENLAREQKCDYMGISVGLTKDYGPAQILYAKRGYVPDGNGVTYDRDGVAKGQACLVDDNLALMMVREL